MNPQGLKDIQFITMSALKGDKVVTVSAGMGWYSGPTLLQHLETVPIAGDRNLADLRFPVQLVLRPNLDFRGFAGTIASGVLKVGEMVKAMPSGKTSKGKSIVTFNGELEEAYAPMSVTVTLEDEIDISRGDMIVHAELESGRKGVEVGTDLDAMVVWMAEQPFVAGKSYWFKQTTRVVAGSMSELVNAVDVNTLEHRPAQKLGLNEVGRVVLALSRSVVFDPYTINPATGAFIIIDRLTNSTVGAGMILGRHDTGNRARGRVTQKEKELRLGQRGAAVWVDRAVADEVERALFDEARTVVRLDAGEVELKVMGVMVRSAGGAGGDCDFERGGG